MRLVILCLFFFKSIDFFSQKRYDLGLSFGSEQFYGNDKGNSLMNYKTLNSFSKKIGLLFDCNISNNKQITLGLNYNYYWNYFEYNINGEIWKPGMSNTFYDLDVHYNYIITDNLKIFLGFNLSFYKNHDKYYSIWYEYQENTGPIAFATETNDVTDFNLGLNTGVKYVINPKSKIKLEPYVLIGVTSFKRDNFIITYLEDSSKSQHFYRKIYSRFGLNIKI